jgi:hypothetical protein
MPQATFEVESYTVLTNQSGTGADGAWRVIQLTSTSSFHGIRNHAIVWFFESPGFFGIVRNVGQLNYNGHTVDARCRMTDFRDFYELLRSERPINFGYSYQEAEVDPAIPGTRNLVNVYLATGLEPPGEGPAELALALTARAE